MAVESLHQLANQSSIRGLAEPPALAVESELYKRAGRTPCSSSGIPSSAGESELYKRAGSSNGIPSSAGESELYKRAGRAGSGSGIRSSAGESELFNSIQFNRLFI